MKKIFIFPITLMTLLVLSIPKVIYGTENNVSTEPQNTLIEKNWCQQSINPFQNINNFPITFSEDFGHIQSINNILIIKYMNRSDLYGFPKEIEKLDSSFVTQAATDITLYANFTPEDFGINSKYYIDNPEKTYNSMLKDTPFGIDYGYFLGSQSKKSLDQSNDEYIQIKMTVPKGTPLVKVGDSEEVHYMLKRDRALRYTEKNFNRENKTINISAQEMSIEEVFSETNAQQDLINHQMKALYGTPSTLIKLNPVGLNAGYVLVSSLDIISKSFEELKSGGILSNGFFNKQTFYLTTGMDVHSDDFDIRTQSMSFEDRQDFFEKNYLDVSLGITYTGNNGNCESIISLNHLDDYDPLPEVNHIYTYSSILLHETFHYLIHTTNHFESSNIFDYESSLENLTKLLKAADEEKLIYLWNSTYAATDWEEFICEALSAKFNPNNDIKNKFKNEIFQTNRFLDNIFDNELPTTPDNLKALYIGGTSLKLTFDHSSDNVGVQLYDIYQDGELIKTVKIGTNDNSLSYPNPGEHLRNTEIIIDGLKQLTDYEFQVVAIDDAQNESVMSAILEVKTKDLATKSLVSTAIR